MEKSIITIEVKKNGTTLADEFNVSTIEQLKALNEENQMRQQCNEEIIQKIRELVK